jgi:hypothetical protein
MDHPLSTENKEGDDDAVFSQWTEDNLASTPKPSEKSATMSDAAAFRPTFSNFRQNHDRLRPPDSFLPVFQQNSKRRQSESAEEAMKTFRRKSLTPSKPVASPSSSAAASPVPVAVPPAFARNLTVNTVFEDVESQANGTGDGDDDDDGDGDDDERVTWTVLVAGMRLLWTLDIRDAVFVVVGDFLHTLEMMKLQRRFNKRESAAAAAALQRSRTLSMGSSTSRTLSTAEMVDVGDGFMLPAGAENFFIEDSDEDEPPSALEHLLLDRRESTASSTGGGDMDGVDRASTATYYRERQMSRDQARHSTRNTLGSLGMNVRPSTSSAALGSRAGGFSPGSVGSPSAASMGRMRSESHQISIAQKTAEKNRREGQEKENAQEKMREMRGMCVHERRERREREKKQRRERSEREKKQRRRRTSERRERREREKNLAAAAHQRAARAKRAREEF